MNSSYRELIVNRIISGEHIIRVDGVSYVLKHPTRRVRYRAELIYQEAFEDARENGAYDDDEVFGLIVNKGIWDDEKQNQLDGIGKDIETLKIGLFDNRNLDEVVDATRTQLRAAENKLAELNAIRNKYNYLSCAGIASAAKLRFLISYCLYHLNGKRVMGWDKPDRLLNSVMEKLATSQINNHNIRELARTDPWAGMWSVNKGNIFGKPTVDWTLEQRSLVSWSLLYDNMRRNNDFPIAIIDDDDMVDGWLIIQNKKNSQGVAERNIKHKLNDKIANSQQVFIFPDKDNNMREIQEIESLNSEVAKMMKKQRNNALKQSGGILNENQMPDTKLRLGL